MGSSPDGSDFDEAVKEIQSWIIQRERALFSERVIEEYHHPRNVGPMKEPDGVGVVHGWCGDTADCDSPMAIYLRVSGKEDSGGHVHD